MVVHIFIFTAIEKLRNPPAQNLLALTCSLCPAQLFVIVGLRYEASHSICVFIATCLHYLFLASAFWMNVLHFDLCRVCFKRSALNKVSSSAREASRAKLRFKLYSYYAWGVPVLIVCGGHLCEYFEPLRDYSPDYAARTFCWINSQTGKVSNLLISSHKNCLFIATPLRLAHAVGTTVGRGQLECCSTKQA